MERNIFHKPWNTLVWHINADTAVSALANFKYRPWFRRSWPGIWAQTQQTQCFWMMGCSGSHLTSQLYLDGTMPQNDGQAVTGYFFAWFSPALSYDTLCVRRCWVGFTRFSWTPFVPTKGQSRNGFKLSIPSSTQEHRPRVSTWPALGPMPGAWSEPQLSPGQIFTCM